MDMGVEGYILASALKAIIAQRLARRICEHCSEPTEIDPGKLAWLEKSQNMDVSQTLFKRGRGCHHCNHTGYRGRIGVYELLELTTATLDALRRNDSAAFTKAALQTPGFIRYSRCACEYAQQGITTVDEVLRLIGTGE
jgi:MSHA biogenesis protein MshE